MSRVCEICNKKSTVTVSRKKLRSKYNPTTKRRQHPNLQWVRLDNGKRVKACAKCIKRMGKDK
ncbi:MAG: 50S ribosomal protein L28 [Candidatus Portnoybacteria bacterium]|nr:50S ribosomal protein L28 [Candidatus Portnoybacteria bacterium]